MRGLRGPQATRGTRGRRGTPDTPGLSWRSSGGGQGCQQPQQPGLTPHLGDDEFPTLQAAGSFASKKMPNKQPSATQQPMTPDDPDPKVEYLDLKEPREVCRFYQASRCHFGSECAYAHVDSRELQKVCRFYQVSLVCRFGSKCKDAHVNAKTPTSASSHKPPQSSQSGCLNNSGVKSMSSYSQSKSSKSTSLTSFYDQDNLSSGMMQRRRDQEPRQASDQTVPNISVEHFQQLHVTDSGLQSSFRGRGGSDFSQGGTTSRDGRDTEVGVAPNIPLGPRRPSSQGPSAPVIDTPLKDPRRDRQRLQASGDTGSDEASFSSRIAFSPSSPNGDVSGPSTTGEQAMQQEGRPENSCCPGGISSSLRSASPGLNPRPTDVHDHKHEKVNTGWKQDHAAIEPRGRPILPDLRSASGISQPPGPRDYRDEKVNPWWKQNYAATNSRTRPRLLNPRASSFIPLPTRRIAEEGTEEVEEAVLVVPGWLVGPSEPGYFPLHGESLPHENWPTVAEYRTEFLASKRLPPPRRGPTGAATCSVSAEWNTGSTASSRFKSCPTSGVSLNASTHCEKI
ncbi:hypothetical protein HD806DRAFT_520116 [Xylariaceae sp. AK1471]|nr:hypothetical protein HD806DRAFT_520116 [Xylariaceae sp. AK1471]